MWWRLSKRYKLALFSVAVGTLIVLLLSQVLRPTRKPKWKAVEPITRYLGVQDVNDSVIRQILNEKYPSVYQNDTILTDTVYDDMFSSNKHFLASLSWPMADRCNYYFDQVLKQNSDTNQPLIDGHRPFKYEKIAMFGWEAFYKEFKQRRWNDEKRRILEELREKRKQELENEGEYDEDMEFSEEEVGFKDDMVKLDEEQVEHDIKELYDATRKIIDHDHETLRKFLSHSRVFNKCFLQMSKPHQDDNIKFVKSQEDFASEWRSRQTHPKHHRWESCRELERIIYPWLTGVSPTVTELTTGKVQQLETNQHDCWLGQWRNRLRRRGIVLTISNTHVDDTVKLIALLQEHKNELPIEIIYREDQLGDVEKEKLTKAAKKWNQSIWMVDITKCVADNYVEKFDGFGYKLLAVLFNTFSEIMLMDADTVLIQPPVYFFDMKKYTQSGTLFFKDRANVEFRLHEDIPWFNFLFPSQADEAVFNIKQVTEHTTQRMFFTDRFNHYMESGVVLIDRSQHFDQPLIMAVLFWFHSIKYRVYGDKELFWLSMAMMGDERYEFNNHHAAAIGKITPKKEYKVKANEICSNHPGHISDEDDHSLLWFNSGFQHCGMSKYVNFEKEFGRKLRYTDIKNVDLFREFMTSRLEIESAIIPPYRQLIANNDKGEPNRAWSHMKEYCDEYTWCGAHQNVGHKLKEYWGDSTASESVSSKHQTEAQQDAELTGV
ncbi:hypothetical protein DIURU_004976 [Diutina rugosa]|uniref:Alpha-1,3-mannosyltransferase n=1 Tax=Diutina rugosa TaxID=5481 RepID=A0A642UFR9_DIURU|nr:uncharacterized protein DIURU_004976 [Diutina rugosa]KAA8898121.1 hypothetical protein DIURU_004976 [Diutina rugosa]